jgi:hypothetical protein
MNDPPPKKVPKSVSKNQSPTNNQKTNFSYFTNYKFSIMKKDSTETQVKTQIKFNDEIMEEEEKSNVESQSPNFFVPQNIEQQLKKIVPAFKNERID